LGNVFATQGAVMQCKGMVALYNVKAPPSWVKHCAGKSVGAGP
jgi:hypothetical protein